MTSNGTGMQIIRPGMLAVFAVCMASLLLIPVGWVHAQAEYAAPYWIKEGMLLYGSGQISDAEFLGMIQYLVAKDVIKAPAGWKDSDKQDIIHRQNELVEILLQKENIEEHNRYINHQIDDLYDQWNEYVLNYSKNTDEVYTEIRLNWDRSGNRQLDDLLRDNLDGRIAEYDERWAKYLADVDELESQYQTCEDCKQRLLDLQNRSVGIVQP